MMLRNQNDSFPPKEVSIEVTLDTKELFRLVIKEPTYKREHLQAIVQNHVAGLTLLQLSRYAHETINIEGILISFGRIY